MELHHLNDESHSINMESQDEESQFGNVRKVSNVRFAPEASTSSGNRFPIEDSDDEVLLLENLSEHDIKTEIYSFLPSNTIGRGKYSNLLTTKSSTFPRKATAHWITDLDKARPHSVVTKKPSFITSLKLATLQRSTAPDGIGLSCESGIVLTEEEGRKELGNIKNFPIQMSEKRKYRDAILDTISIHDRQKKTFCSGMKDCWKSIKQSASKFELWHNTLKRIEGLHGTGVVSYFVFLRWLIILNLILFILCFLFITMPHTIFTKVPLKQILVAPNRTVITETFLNQFPDSKDLEVKPVNSTNFSINLKNKDLISSLDTYFTHYLPEEILDVTLNYGKKNATFEERRKNSAECADRYRKEELSRPSDILSVCQDLLQGTGWLESTVLFLGYYSATEVLYFGLPYNIPVAIVCVLFFSFVLCLFMMVRYSSHGVQETILARKSNYLLYSNIIFCSWDYCIENKKSSIVRHKSILHEIKSTLAEERRREEVKEWSKTKKLKVHFLRIIINIFVLASLCASYYVIYKVVNIQLTELQLHRLKESGSQTLFVQYLTPIVITCLNIFVPIIFNAIVKFEMYNTQTQINITLIRVVFLRLSSVFVLVGLLYQQITCEPKDRCNSGLNSTCRSPICWETYVGQQLYKLAITDFIVYIMLFLAYDLPRDLLVQGCRNKVTKLIGRQVFDLPNQVLSLVYSQTLCWLGIVYSPLLPLITVIKFIVLFYIKKVFVLKHCIPPPIPYKASRSNAMFIVILLLSFFAIMIIHGYSLSSIEPSPACSPFRYYNVMVDAITDALYPRSSAVASIINLIFSGIFLFPVIILLCIAIYYYWTIVVANRKMAKVLKAQIVLEGRDKQFLLNRLTQVAKGHID